MRLLRLIGKSIIDFFRDDGLMLAGSMSYFIMMALVPFCLFMLTLFGYLLGHYPEFTKFLLNRLVNLFPEVTNQITGEILKLMSFKGLGKVSLFLSGFLSFQVFVSVENSLNVVFKVKKRRHLISSVIISLVVMTFIIAFLLISFSATSVTQLLVAFKPYFPYLKIGKVTHFIIPINLGWETAESVRP